MSGTRPLIYVLGVGRSGTTLLQSMLNAHPDIAFMPETHFFRYYVARKRVRCRLENRGLEAFRQVLATDLHFQRAGIEQGKLLPRDTGGQRLSLSGTYLRLVELFGEQSGALVVGDKDPRNIDYVRELARVTPQAVVVHIIRDPRDVVLSRSRTSWSAGRPPLLNALIYDSQLRRGRRDGMECFGDRYIEVRYESLLDNPVAVLGHITRSVDLEFDPAMIASLKESAKELVVGDEIEWKQNVFGSLMKKNFGKWKTELSSTTVAMVEGICTIPFRERMYNISHYWIRRLLFRVFSYLPRAMFRVCYGAVVKYSLLKNPRDQA